MSAAAKSEELIQLARSRRTADRERLLLAVADLCDASQASRAPQNRRLLDDVFMALVVEAERDIRRSLAEKLARADWAPKALIDVLALDEIEIARPIIASSPLLADADLVRLMVEATVEHQIEVARRPNIGPAVVEAALDRAEPAVLTALATNDSADLGESGMRRLVEHSRRIAALRSPLVRHPKLTRLMAEQLYAWVGQTLKGAIADRFRVDPTELDRAVADAVRDAQAPRAFGPAVSRDDQREEMERRLIAKLQSAGQLRPGYLVRALKERKLSLFETALAALGGFAVEDVRRAAAAPDPAPLALACAAVGIDRVVFGSILAMVRDLNGGRPSAEPEALRTAGAAFRADPAIAGRAFREAVAPAV